MLCISQFVCTESLPHLNFTGARRVRSEEYEDYEVL